MSSCWPPPPKICGSWRSSSRFRRRSSPHRAKGSSRPVLIVVATLFTRVRLQGFFNAVDRVEPLPASIGVAGICAFRPAGVDVKPTLQTTLGTSELGRGAALQAPPQEGPALQAPPREGAQWVPKLPFHCERELGFAALSRHSGRRWGAPHRIKKEGAAQYYRAISKRRAHRNYPTSTIRARPDSRRCRASRPSARRWCRRYKGRTARPPRVLTDERG